MRRWMWICTMIFQKSFAQFASIPQITEAPVLYKNNSPKNGFYFTRPSTQVSTELTQIIIGTDLFLQNLTYSREKGIHKFNIQTNLFGSPELLTANLQYGHLLKISNHFNFGGHIGLNKIVPTKAKTFPELGWFISSTIFNHPFSIRGFYQNNYQLHAVNYCRVYSNSNLNMGYVISTLDNYGYVHISNILSKKIQTNLQIRTNGNYLLELNYKQENWQLAYEFYSIRNLGIRNTIRIIYELERNGDVGLGSEHILPNSEFTN